MPKNSTATILSRWREMDLLLTTWELVIPRFARRHRVSPKTIRRDIEGFREMDQVIGRSDHKDVRRNAFVWGYTSGTTPLFRQPAEDAGPPAVDAQVEEGEAVPTPEEIRRTKREIKRVNRVVKKDPKPTKPPAKPPAKQGPPGGG